MVIGYIIRSSNPAKFTKAYEYVVWMRRGFGDKATARYIPLIQITNHTFNHIIYSLGKTLLLCNKIYIFIYLSIFLYFFIFIYLFIY